MEKLLPEDYIYFEEYDCICEHSPEDHGWTGCRAEECECVACWTE